MTKGPSMKRALLTIAVLLLATLTLAACGDGGQSEIAETTATPDPSPAPSAAEGFDPIAIAGPGEAAALAALPAALESQREAHAQAGGSWPDLAGVEPILTAYLLRVEMDDQITLFEVRADGIVHSLYAYQKAFDSGSLVWTPADMAAGPTAVPQSAAEKAAAEAVRAAMVDAFEGQGFEVAMFGYRFSYVKDGLLLLNMSVDPAGGAVGVETFGG